MQPRQSAPAQVGRLSLIPALCSDKNNIWTTCRRQTPADTEGEHNMKQMPPQMEDKQAHTFLLRSRTVSDWLLQSGYSEPLVFKGSAVTFAVPPKATVELLICTDAVGICISIVAFYSFASLTRLLTWKAQFWGNWVGLCWAGYLIKQVIMIKSWNSFYMS